MHSDMHPGAELGGYAFTVVVAVTEPDVSAHAGTECGTDVCAVASTNSGAHTGTERCSVSIPDE